MITTKSILPYNIFAETVVIASILTNSDSINFVSQILTVDSFYLQSHQHIYKAALILNSNQKIVDIVTISSWLQDNNLIQEIGGTETLNKLTQTIVNNLNLKEYTELVNEKYTRRLLINFGNEIINLSYQTNLPIEKIFKLIEQKLFKLNEKNTSQNLNTTGEVLSQILTELKKKKNKNSFFSGYLSRFYDLNAITNGFQKSDLIIIAGRPSMGKTAFSLHIAKDICSKYNIPIIFFSLEMTKEQLVYRLLAMETEISVTNLKSVSQNSPVWDRMYKALENLSTLPFHIDDTPNISLTEIHFKIKKIKAKYGFIGAIIIDYLQLLESTKKTENRVQEISQITRTLKNFAREFKMPVIVLSQLSRNVESRNNKRPILSDLRESGCLNLEFLNCSTVKNIKKKFFYQQLFSYTIKNQQILKTPLFKLKCTGFKPVYKIKVSINNSINLTSNHKLLSKNFWKEINKLKKNCSIKINLSSLFPNIFPKTIITEKIKKITYIGIKSVYDFEVLKFKNFLTNYFLLHNSIEQDADVVLMLYRGNQYFEEGNEKNITELIIAKHRNGPIGKIKLRFDGNLTKFFNYS
uniref:DNA replication helicase n=1 Tax=Vacuolaria virescens TaxID=44451 RepID=UPI0021146D04|nr:DNA replication helicase [Vacuolaria virescens]UTE94701.1 DNA replication helicase [Vacuolaria virescens]